MNSINLDLTRTAKRIVRKVFPKKEEKRSSWFKNYHSVEGAGLAGLRDKDQSRTDLFRAEDMQGKFVVDAGCNMGAISKLAADLGARRVLGIDYDWQAIERARSLFDDTVIDFVCDDLDNPIAIPQKIDTALFLSVFGTREIEDRISILSRVSAASDVMYIEGHHGELHSKYTEALLKYTNFTKIELLAYTNDEMRADSIGRPFLRCDKEAAGEEFFFEKIRDIVESSDSSVIAVIGKSGVGKTFLRRRLEDEGLQRLLIEDDEPRPGKPLSGHYILFDFRAAQYLDGITHIFMLDVNEGTRLGRLRATEDRNDNYNLFLQSPPLNFDVENIYRISLV